MTTAAKTTDFTDHHVELGTGRIRYREIGAGEPGAEVLVFVHGFAVDGQLWEPVARLLAAGTPGHRCIVPTWPLGSHLEPMRPDADRTPAGVARLVADFLVALDLDGVTIVGNDSGGAVSQGLVTTSPERIGRLVLTNCDCLEIFPPGVFKLISKALRLPGSGAVLANSMRLESIIRAPFGFGALNKKRQPIELLRSWVRPLIEDRDVRRDALSFFAAADPSYTLGAAEKLPELKIPVLLAWGEEDSFFTVGHAERLRELIPDATLVRIPDAKTFVPLDQPEAVASAIADFIAAKPLD